MVFEKIREIIADQLGKEIDEITMETRVKEDLAADSLDLFQIINEIEDEFDVKIEDAESIQTVADAVKFATANPARIMHYSKKGILAPSYDGDVVVMDKKFSVKLVVLKNETIVKNKLEEK